MRYVDATGLSSFNGSWDGQKLHFVVPVLNIMAEKYDPYELAENLPKELRRAQKESQELNSLLELLPYLSCEPPVIFGGTEPHLTCTATNAREMAEVIINWQAEKLRIGLHKNWDQARQNRAAEQAMAQLWTAKPLPFAGRVHAGPDLTNETLSPETSQLQSHHESQQLHGTDLISDSQPELLDDSIAILKIDHAEEGANEVIVDNAGTKPEERPDYAILRRQTLDDVLRETENLEIPALIDIAANHSQKHRLWRAIDDLEESGEYYRLPAEQIERYRYIYLAVCYGKDYAHARFACNDPNLTDEERRYATILFDHTYSYNAYESPATQLRDNAFIERVIMALNDPDRITIMNRHYRNLTLATNQKEREDIFITMSNDILNYIRVDLPVEFDPKLGRTRMGEYRASSSTIYLGSRYFSRSDLELEKLVGDLPGLLAHECMHHFQHLGIHPDVTDYTNEDRTWNTWKPNRVTPGYINFDDYKLDPDEAQAYYVMDSINDQLKELNIISSWLSQSSW